jgi:GT2 family glycosyltransferase/glycosyltransferase involved in cell wall biosynthesis
MNDYTGALGSRRRVLIADFDFFTSVGGGQVFYRRVVERNPSIDFYYPSCSSDLKLKVDGQLPFNAHPFAYDPRLDVTSPRRIIGEPWIRRQHSNRMACIAAAVQGMTFQAVDIPSFFPAANVARQVMTACGVMVERIALGLVGWQSVSAKNAYEAPDTLLLKALETAERESMEAADVRYSISRAEQVENAGVALPVTVLDMRDAIEAFALPDPEPPGSGPPDLWYVGRLDGAKAPDLFIELVSRMPRKLYSGCFLAGPDNPWADGARWSAHVVELARSRRVKASYEGVLSDSEIRRRVYRGRSVLVIPSRTDAFNYVALEGILNGCPLLLSERTGAFGFLSAEHPYLLPPAMTPDRMDAAAESLRGILSNYDSLARGRRKELRDRPFPPPRLGFMDAVYNAPPIRSATRQETIARETGLLRQNLPLLSPALRDWRSARPAPLEPRVTVVIPTLDRPELLAPALASLTRQTLADMEVVVVDDGSKNAILVRSVAEAFMPMVRFIRTGNAGEAAAVNRGIEAARGEFIGFLSDDDAYAPELLAESVAVLEREPDAIGTYPDWDIVDTSGYFIEAHRLPEFDRKLMLVAHWCLPGPGVVVRRRVLQMTGGRDISFRFVSDFDLWLRATRYGRMIHLPLKLAYWRLHDSNLTTSDRRRQLAQERLTLIEKLFMDPAEESVAEVFPKAYAAASLAAAAILGRTEPDEAIRHLKTAMKLAPDLMKNLPVNMAGYPDLWPAMTETGGA